ncbi:FAD-dependent oxidoreductase [Heyndrickxia sp. NPDC080065]|uniref:FAD-dependent oxidoreductase n=1 Tax=Heyndrickxia sp. NPDC080065 TaxID=3390568 RepID=UPI003D08C6F5
MDTDILIIGGGPSGVEAALTASRYANHVTLVTKGNVCEWKAGYTNIFLANVEEIKKHQSFSLPSVDNINKEWEVQQKNLLVNAGVQILFGTAAFQNSHSVKIVHDSGETTIITSKKIIIANGSRPVFPESIQPDGKRIFSFRNLYEMNYIPASIIVIGDGPIGYEMVNLYIQLNIQVTWLLPEKRNQLFDEDITEYLISYYSNNGVKIERGTWVKELNNCGNIVRAVREDGKVFEAETAFITLGFRSNLDQLQMEHANLQMNHTGSIDSNPFGQSDNESIYIIGDARMPHSYTVTQALAMARVATLHALNQNTDPIDPNTLPLAFNENPQVATVGYVTTSNEEVDFIKVPYEKRNFRAFMDNKRDGFIKIVWNKDGTIIGGTCIGHQAKDIITTISLMIKLKATISQVQSFFGAHPSITELPFFALRDRQNQIQNEITCTVKSGRTCGK